MKYREVFANPNEVSRILTELSEEGKKVCYVIP